MILTTLRGPSEAAVFGVTRADVRLQAAGEPPQAGAHLQAGGCVRRGVHDLPVV